MFAFRIGVYDSNSLEALDLRTQFDESGPQIEASKDAIMAAVVAALAGLPGHLSVSCSKIEQTETTLEAP